MTAKECLALDRDYSPYKGTYVLRIVGDKLINSTGSFIENGMEYGFYKTDDYDGRIIQGLPGSIDFQLYHRREFMAIIKRLNKFFADLVEDAEIFRFDYDRELVNLRINVNLIYNLPLTREQKLCWTTWIKELFWSRRVLLNRWYIENVLPF